MAMKNFLLKTVDCPGASLSEMVFATGETVEEAIAASGLIGVVEVFETTSHGLYRLRPAPAEVFKVKSLHDYGSKAL